jgi:hypothetical protein
VEPRARERIERELGRSLRDDEVAPVTRLCEIAPAQLALLRDLARRSSLLAMRYVEAVADVSRGDAGHFVEEVGLGGQAPMAWQYRDVLCAVSVADVRALLGLSVDALLAPVLALDAALLRQRPTPDAWKRLALLDGPGVVVRGADRGWRAPAGTQTHLLGSPHTVLEPVVDRTIETRRWIASRVAHHLGDGWRSAAGADGLLAALGVAADAVSADGRAAVAGLAREAHLPRDLVPGFGGPADGYA